MLIEDFNILEWLFDLFYWFQSIADELWIFLSTPLLSLIRESQMPDWLKVVITTYLVPLLEVWGVDLNILQLIPVFIILILIVRFILVLVGRGAV